MSKIHISQLKGHLEQNYRDHVDLSDLSEEDPEIEKKALTRCLAAYCIVSQSGCDIEIAASSIVDGQQDNGIDGIYLDRSNRTMYIVQAKWSDAGKGGIDQEGALKFIKGIRGLLNAKYEDFNERVGAKKEDIEWALNNHTSFQVIYAHTGTEQISDDVNATFGDAMQEFNSPVDIVFKKFMSLKDLYQSLISEGKPSPIMAEVTLNEWGSLSEPYQAYYGQICAIDIADLYNQFGLELFSPNLRVFLGSTEVNKSIESTIMSEPEKFWYFNNGITVLCDRVKKYPRGGGNKSYATFECEGLRIVNGAQTAGAIASSIRGLDTPPEDIKVHIRLISLEDSPECLARAITIATNTQNTITKRDFVATEAEQIRLKDELLIDSIGYILKSGERIENKNCSFDINEATIAMACSRPALKFAMAVKREISSVWEDIESNTYKTLFNPSVSGRKLWGFVQIQRVIDLSIVQANKTLNDYGQKCTQHGNRFIAHEVFKRLRVNVEDANSLEQALHDAKIITEKIAQRLPDITEKIFPNLYLGNIFKSFDKCTALSNAMLTSLDESISDNDNEELGDLFSQMIS